MKFDQMQKVNEVCRISEGSRLSGTMHCESDIRIDGEFDGTLYTCGRLVIGEHAAVSGTIFCQNADIWGKVSAKMFVQEIFDLKESAGFDGELKTSKLSIEMGSSFNGPCHILHKDEFDKAYRAAFPKKGEITSFENENKNH